MNQPDNQNSYKRKFPVDLYYVIFNNSNICMALIDPDDNRILEVNEEFINATGYTQNELHNKNLTGIKFLDINDWIRISVNTNAAGRLEDTTLKYYKKTGTPGYGLFTVNDLSNGDEKLLLLTFTDITGQKEAEETLKEILERYHLISENAGDVIWLLDIQTGMFKYVSPSVKKLRGFSVEEVMKQSLADALTSESYKIIKEKLNETIKKFEEGDDSVRIQTHEIDQVCKNGSIIQTEVVTSFLTNEKGKVTEISGLSRDITESKIARKNLLEQNELLQKMSRIAKVGGWEYDFITMKGKWTDEVARIHDLDPKEKTNVEIKLSFYKGESRNKIEKAVKDAVESAKPYDLELEFTSAKGILKIVHITGIPSTEKGKVVKVSGIFQDITELKQAEESLRASRQIIEGIINAIPVRVFWKDMNLVYMGCNEIFARDAGFTDPKDIIGKDDYQMGWRLQADLYRGDDRQVIDSGSPRLLVEEPQTTPDGNTITLLTSKIPLLDSKGEISGVVGTYMDITERKRAEESLLKNETLLYTAIKLANLGYWEYDIPSDLFTFNDQFYSLFHTSAESEGGYQMSSRNYAEKFVHPDDVSIVSEEINKAIETTEPSFGRQFEHRIVYADGEMGYINVRFFVVKNSKGITVKTFGVNQDITENKLAEQKIRESDSQYRSLFENMLNGFSFCKMLYENNEPVDFIYINVNSAFESLTGLNNVKNKPVSEVIPGILKANPELFEKLNRVALTGKPEVFEIYIESLKMWFSISVYSPKKEYFVAVFDVITNRKLAEQTLKASEESFTRVFHSNPNASALTRCKDNVIIDINEAWENITGYKKHEIIGHTSMELNVWEKPEQREKMLKTIQDKGNIHNSDIQVHQKNGNVKNALISAEIIDFKGEQCMLTVAQDITELKHHENELLEAKLRAERSDKLKDAFIANISHEIRTPLNGILGMTGLLQNSVSKYLKKEDKEYFKAIDWASARIIRTIDMILNFSRVQIGDFPIKPVKLNLPLMIQNLVKEYKSAAESKGIKLSFENSAVDVELIIDEYSIGQAISNLLDNAIKYTIKGKVKLILYYDNGGELKLNVQDSGIGISNEYLPHLFEPYSQEEVGYNRGYEGVGLGMSLIKRYLDLNNAEINVVSNKDIGTTFTITFNRNITKEKKIKPEPVNIQKVVKPNISAIRKETLTILMVEDDSINQMYMRSVLQKKYSVTGVYSAEKALDALKFSDFDLILMDISLKGNMNGLELTKLIKADKKFKHIPVIAVTGHASPEDMQNCFKAGCSEFLSKPFMSSELLAKIEAFIEKGN